MAVRVAMVMQLCAGVMLLACGETSHDSTPSAGGGQTSSAGSGATSGGGGAKTTPGGATSGGGGAQSTPGDAGAAGTVAAGGSAPQPTPCGGELVGKWHSFDPNVPPITYPNINECWNLQGGFRGDAYSAYSRYPKPSGERLLLRFRADGSYTVVSTNEGPISVEYAASCLELAGSPTCRQLQAALRESGIGEGSYQNAMCSDRVDGGCACTIRVDEIGGGTGVWTANVQDGSLQLSPSLPRMGSPPTSSTHYCVDGAELRFTDDIEQVWPRARGAVLSSIGCENGIEDWDEGGVDCGGDCAQGCPVP